MKEVSTTRFGTLMIPEDAVIQFPQALMGLDYCKEWCLLEQDAPAGFFWLQSLNNPCVALILTDPFRHVPDYQAELPDEAVALLGIQEPSEVTLYTTVSVDADSQLVYTNLLGPLAIHHEARRGQQVIQHGSGYPTRHEISLTAGAQEC